MAAVDPMVSRRRLAMTLRQARRDAGLSQKEVAGRLFWASSKVIRIEMGDSTVTPVDLRALLGLYGVTDESRIGELVDEARASRQQAWWSPYRQWLSQEYIQLLAYEASASTIFIYELALVPGLFQTEEYARELMRAYRAAQDVNEEEINQLVAVRLERQERLLEHEDPPELWVYLDEAVLWRRLSSPDATRRQVDQIRTISARPNIHVTVVPSTSQLHQALSGPLMLLEFADHDDEDVLFLERIPGSNIVRDDPAALSRARVALDTLAEFALPPDELDRLFDKVLAELPEQ